MASPPRLVMYGSINYRVQDYGKRVGVKGKRGKGTSDKVFVVSCYVTGLLCGMMDCSLWKIISASCDR